MRLSLASLLVLAACSHPEATVATLPPATAPATAPAPATAGELDLVSPITAGSGHEEPHNMQWGDGGKKPASTIFKNVHILGDLSGDRFMAGMQGMEANLGQKCSLCHVGHDFPADTKPEKAEARKMLAMAYQIDHDYFRGHARVSCFTCHRGNETPPDMDPKIMARKPVNPMPTMTAEQAKLPAEQVWKNIQLLKGMPAGRLPMVMNIFSGVLGVSCNFCHVENDFASDDKHEKIRAREMITMVKAIDGTYFPGVDKGNVGCWTCHQGNSKPAREAVAK